MSASPDEPSPLPTVCLIRPPAAESFRLATTSIALPIGLAYVAAALEASGRAVAVVDAVAAAPTARTRYFKGYLTGLPADQIVARVPESARLVGISVLFTNEWPAVSRLVDELKRARPEVTVVLGGEHVTAMPELTLLTSRADVLVLGEGEETIVELADALERGEPLSGIAGLAYREDGQVVVNPRRARRTGVDDVAPPAWHLFDLETYHRHRFVGGMYTSRKTIPILATRGCPYQCTYCSAPGMWTPTWIPRDPVKVADEIQSYVERWGATCFPFQDLTAIIQKKWIVDFCQELLRRELDIVWQLPTGTRSEAIDAEVADLLRRTGMICMSYAPESGSEETRRLIKKKLKRERLVESLRAAVGAGLNVSCFFVVGFPHDTREQIAETLPLMDELADAGATDVSCAFYMALPGTELFESLYDSGKIRLDRAYFRHILSAMQLVATQTYCPSLSRIELTWWKLRLMLRFYGRKRRAATGRTAGLGASLRRAASGLLSRGGHTSKLQSVIRNAVHSLWITMAVRTRPGWMTRRAERRFFAGWDAIYREIRRRNLEQGAAEPAPADSRELHRRSVVPLLARTHGVRRTVPDVALADTVAPEPAG